MWHYYEIGYNDIVHLLIRYTGYGFENFPVIGILLWHFKNEAKLSCSLNSK